MIKHNQMIKRNQMMMIQKTGKNDSIKMKEKFEEIINKNWENLV